MIFALSNITVVAQVPLEPFGVEFVANEEGENFINGEIGKNICDLEFADLEDVIVELIVAEVYVVLVGGCLHGLLFLHPLISVVAVVILLAVAKILLLLLLYVGHLINYNRRSSAYTCINYWDILYNQI